MNHNIAKNDVQTAQQTFPIHKVPPKPSTPTCWITVWSHVVTSAEREAWPELHPSLGNSQTLPYFYLPAAVRGGGLWLSNRGVSMCVFVWACACLCVVHASVLSDTRGLNAASMNHDFPWRPALTHVADLYGHVPHALSIDLSHSP